MMKSSFAVFFQVVIVVVGIGALAFLLWEPHIEGRNAHATTFQIYCNDPFLAYVYLGSTPFFVALYRAFGLFGHVRRIRAFSPETVDALRAIKRCAVALLGFVAVGVVIILSFGDPDDRPAGIFLSFLIAFASSVTGAVAATLARKLEKTLTHSGGRPAAGHA